MKKILRWDFWGLCTRVLNGHPSNFPDNFSFLHFFQVEPQCSWAKYYVCCVSLLYFFVVCFGTIRWSTVEHPESLQWCHNKRHGISNHQHLDCLLNRSFWRISKKAPRYWPLWGESSGYRWIPSQRASNAETVSIWWRHHEPPACAFVMVTCFFTPS